MRIQYNAAAMNTYRNMNMVWKQQSALSERLSSGYAINGAADNAAGLKISEKMRGQIRGLNQASKNAQDGISLLQTADGALNEVHSMLQRIRELSVQAASDTNVTADRTALQEEVDGLLKEIDRIGETTEFNTRKLFDGSLSVSASQVGSSSYYQLVEQTGNGTDNNMNVFFVEQDYTAIQTTSGTATMAGYTALKEALKNSIVPQAVNTIVDTYQNAFGYLKDSSIGIGLELYSKSSSNVLASASVTLVSTSTGLYGAQYMLSINLAKLDMDTEGNLTEDGRTELEATVLHEMIHAFMYEATTNGALGIVDKKSDTSVKYPNWFMEGMAQTLSGGYSNSNDWVNIALGITTSTSETAIQTILNQSKNKITNTVSGNGSYGTGYLACMYLGMLASGKEINVANVTGSNIADGLDYILSSLIDGSSLNDVISSISSGTYTSVADFQSKFGDSASVSFIKELTAVVGEGNGSLAGKDLTKVDLLPDVNTTNSLFTLNTENTTITNIYPKDVNVFSGGTASTTGTEPVDGYTPPAFSGGTSGGGTTGGGTTGATAALVGLHLQAGANNGQSITVDLGEISTNKLGINILSIMNHTEAAESITKVEAAISQVSSARSKIGACQNRLEFTIENLDNTAENLTTAESRIRDMDIAEAMVDYAKNQILIQAGQSMLAQVNQSNEGILGLLS